MRSKWDISPGINQWHFAKPLFNNVAKSTVEGGIVIKRIIVIAATLLLITSCANNQYTNKQAAPDQTNVSMQSRNSAPSLTQASSISTIDANKSSIRMQQSPDDFSSWLDWFFGNRGQAGNPAANPPVNPQQPTDTPQQPANPQQPAQPADSSRFPQQVLDIVNKERKNAGLQPLSMNDSLSKVAMIKAQDMYNNNYFDHQSPTYGSPFDMMRSNGITYNTAGENIAKGQRGPTEVMNAWMNSPGHRANILNRSFTQIGIAYYKSEWVQEFIG